MKKFVVPMTNEEKYERFEKLLKTLDVDYIVSQDFNSYAFYDGSRLKEVDNVERINFESDFEESANELNDLIFMVGEDVFIEAWGSL